MSYLYLEIRESTRRLSRYTGWKMYKTKEPRVRCTVFQPLELGTV